MLVWFVNIYINFKKANKWLIDSRCRLHFSQFEVGKSIVFNEASGQTHIVNELCTDALHVLQQFPLDALTLAESLAQRNDFSLDEEWSKYIDNMLADLDQWGLVEPVLS